LISRKLGFSVDKFNTEISVFSYHSHPYRIPHKLPTISGIRLPNNILPVGIHRMKPDAQFIRNEFAAVLGRDQFYNLQPLFVEHFLIVLPGFFGDKEEADLVFLGNQAGR
jgi:hypothetical protein